MNVEIRPSNIHGKGVFANEEIEKGHWQYIYGEIRHLQPGDPFEHYGLRVNEEDDSEVYMPYAPFCRTNHSEEPNCDVVLDVSDPDKPVYLIEALRDIEPNEELTIDYGFTPEND